MTDIGIKDLSLDELELLNKTVVARIRELHAKKQQAAALAFNVGDIASFRRSKWPLGDVTIQITKINGKTVGGVELDAAGKSTGKRWNVSPTLLKAVETA